MTPRTGPVFVQTCEPLPDQHLHVPSADGTDADEAHLINVLHEQADLIAVPGQHDSRTAAGIHHRREIAVPIGVNLGGKRSCELADHLLDAGFVTGRSGRIEEIVSRIRAKRCPSELQN